MKCKVKLIVEVEDGRSFGAEVSNVMVPRLLTSFEVMEVLLTKIRTMISDILLNELNDK